VEEKTMKKKQDIMKDLDQAIDAMDTDGIDRGLEDLADIETHPIPAENANLFAARIKKMNKENVKMIKPRKFMKAAVVAAAILTVGVSVYAANPFNIFSIVQDNRLITVRTNESITDVDGNQMEVQFEFSPDAPKHDEAEVNTQKYTFDTVTQAEEELDIKLVLPYAVNQMKLESATGETAKDEGAESQNARISYTDLGGHKIDITIARIITDMAVISEHEFEEGSLDTYKNKYGVEFTMFTMSDKQIYFAAIGEYEYSVYFTGYNEKEQKEIMDTVNLSEYE